jgi:hypothetical protein
VASREARAVLVESGDAGYAGYDAQLDGLIQRRPPEEARHDSVAASGLASIETYLRGTLADGVLPASATLAWQRRKIEVALGAWATLRHDVEALARLPSPATPAPPPPVTPAVIPAPPLVAFVEPHPEAIAQLVAMVEQASRGLTALGTIDAPPPTSIAGAALGALRTCLAVALREANDEPLDPDESARLAELPALLVELEARLAPVRASERPLVADVHADAANARVLEEAVGAIDDLFLVVREPGTARLVLALGASLAHHELVQPAALRLGDGEWRARLAASPPPRAPWTSAYVVSAPSAGEVDGGR